MYVVPWRLSAALKQMFDLKVYNSVNQHFQKINSMYTCIEWKFKPFHVGIQFKSIRESEGVSLAFWQLAYAELVGCLISKNLTSLQISTSCIGLDSERDGKYSAITAQSAYGKVDAGRVVEWKETGDGDSCTNFSKRVWDDVPCAESRRSRSARAYETARNACGAKRTVNKDRRWRLRGRLRRRLLLDHLRGPSSAILHHGATSPNGIIIIIVVNKVNRSASPCRHTVVIVSQRGDSWILPDSQRRGVSIEECCRPTDALVRVWLAHSPHRGGCPSPPASTPILSFAARLAPSWQQPMRRKSSCKMSLLIYFIMLLILPGVILRSRCFYGHAVSDDLFH